MLRRWPEIRAGLLALAIGLGAVDGCPIPPRRDTLPWQAPIVERIRPVQEAVLAPLRWVTRGLRFSQRWALMQVGPRLGARLTVEGRPAAGLPSAPWEVLYRAGDPAHAAFADVLEQHQIYGTWCPTERLPRQQPAFARWFAAYVLAARPDLAEVRLSYEQVTIADGALTPTGRFVWGSVHARAARGRR